MNESTPRTCILCKHMHFDAGDRAYSDVTPETDWSAFCEQNHWGMSGYNVLEATYYQNLLTAQTCPDFDRATERW